VQNSSLFSASQNWCISSVKFRLWRQSRTVSFDFELNAGQRSEVRSSPAEHESVSGTRTSTDPVEIG
ncbi:hypothetical protein PO909_025980, partial [Leuciscus waleckii]